MCLHHLLSLQYTGRSSASSRTSTVRKNDRFVFEVTTNNDAEGSQNKLFGSFLVS